MPNIDELCSLEHLTQVERWLEANVVGTHNALIENVAMDWVTFFTDVSRGVLQHSSGFKNRAPIGQVFDPQRVYRGWYGQMTLDTKVTVSDVYDNPYEHDFFAGLPIHKINFTGLTGGWREKDLWYADALVSEKKPRLEIVEAWQKCRLTIFMFGDDFQPLTDSAHVMEVLTAA